MDHVPISELRGLIGEDVQFSGWVKTIRDQKKMQFLVVGDRSGIVQATNEKGDNDLSVGISRLTENSTIRLHGKVVKNVSVAAGGIEVIIEDFEVLSISEPSLPIKEDSALDSRMDWRYIDLRNDKKRLIFEIQTCIENAMRRYWIDNSFIEIHTPKLMGAASEGGAELFTMPYFDTEACLAQSPQFYKQMAMAAGFEKVFEIGPVFRANPSFTPRHDTEFTSVDMEVSWIDSHEDVMSVEEEWIQSVLKDLSERYGSLIEEIFGTRVVVPEIPFPRITMEEAHRILNRMGYIVPRTSKDMDPEGERLICEHVREEYGHEFVFVTDYPVAVRPFYHMRYDDRQDLTKSFDLLWKGLEVTTGAQREHRHEILLSQIDDKGISRESLKGYTDFFRYGCPPHGGLGFGLTRMLALLLGYKNVREVTFLYRGPKRLSP